MEFGFELCISVVLRCLSTETHCQECVCGVLVCVGVVGAEFEVRAKCVVNATGPYTDFVRRLDSPKCRKICQPSSGVHVVLPEYYRYCRT